MDSLKRKNRKDQNLSDVESGISNLVRQTEDSRQG